MRLRTPLTSARPAWWLLAALACVGSGMARGQEAAELQPLTIESVQPGLQRSPGATVIAPHVLGVLDLKGLQFYIAEYQVLVEVGGDLPLPRQEGRVLGLPVSTPMARVSWLATADIAALQQLVDLGWADLQTRFRAAGLPLLSARELLGVTPAVYEADAPASTPDRPQWLDVMEADRRHRYLVMAPSGMPILPRNGVVELNPGNVLARVNHVAQKVEALSLGVAFNLSGQDPSAGLRPSPYRLASGAGGLQAHAIAPWLEVASVSARPLIETHVQNQSVRLAEALALKPEFGRLVGSGPGLADSPGLVTPVLSASVNAAMSLGRLVGLVPEAMTPLSAVLELDGPGLSRGLGYGLFSANQAIVNALLAAR